MKKTVILFTGNRIGGVLQLIATLYNVLKKLDYNVFCFVPEDAELHIKDFGDAHIIRYNTRNHSNKFLDKALRYVAKNPSVLNVAKQVEKINPDYVWLVDNHFYSVQVGLQLNRDKQFCILTMHDAGTSHPTRLSLKARFRSGWNDWLSGKLEKKADKILLLSDNSRESYRHRHPEYEPKLLSFSLGAHVPECDDVKPSEVSDYKYHLFFGRLDKYKGISTLAKAYSSTKDLKSKLIIAGNGILSDEELRMIKNNPNIILIKRYIDDGEMRWLIRNAVSVVLPYIEATQSGVIPISYYFGTPVICSNLPGLTQFVESESTGFICETLIDYQEAFRKMEDKNIRFYMGKKAIEYNDKYLNWEKNVSGFLNTL